jgi:hypothetical protein
MKNEAPPAAAPMAVFFDIPELRLAIVEGKEYEEFEHTNIPVEVISAEVEVVEVGSGEEVLEASTTTAIDMTSVCLVFYNSAWPHNT